MKYFDWNEEKNRQLKENRDISFELAKEAILVGNVLDIVEQSISAQHPLQKMFVLNIDNYAYVVPFVEDDEKIFLKTIYPSRVYTKKFFENSKEVHAKK